MHFLSDALGPVVSIAGAVVLLAGGSMTVARARREALRARWRALALPSIAVRMTDDHDVHHESRAVVHDDRHGRGFYHAEQGALGALHAEPVPEYPRACRSHSRQSCVLGRT
jgi:hypothetical protein